MTATPWTSDWRPKGHRDDCAPPSKTIKSPKTQDGRKLRRYRRRWKVERLFAWLGNFRRLPVRYEHKLENVLAFVQLGCIIILLEDIYEMIDN